MLKSIATDSAWANVSWSGTQKKLSFSENLSAIYNVITSIAVESFPAQQKDFWVSRIKVFLRHTNERIQRQSKPNKSSEELA